MTAGSQERAYAKSQWVAAVGRGEDYPCPYWGIADCFFHHGGNCNGACRYRDEYLDKRR